METKKNDFSSLIPLIEQCPPYHNDNPHSDWKEASSLVDHVKDQLIQYNLSFDTDATLTIRKEYRGGTGELKGYYLFLKYTSLRINVNIQIDPQGNVILIEKIKKIDQDDIKKKCAMMEASDFFSMEPLPWHVLVTRTICLDTTPNISGGKVFKPFELQDFVHHGSILFTPEFDFNSKHKKAMLVSINRTEGRDIYAAYYNKKDHTLLYWKANEFEYPEALAVRKKLYTFEDYDDEYEPYEYHNDDEITESIYRDNSKEPLDFFIRCICCMPQRWETLYIENDFSQLKQAIQEREQKDSIFYMGYQMLHDVGASMINHLRRSISFGLW